MNRVHVLLTLVLAAPLSAQAASVTTFGVGCPGSVPSLVPTISVVGLPQLGATVQIDYAGPNGWTGSSVVQPILVFGFQQIAPIAIPTSLFPQQTANCVLHTTHDFVVPMTPYPQFFAYLTSYSLTVPNQVQLIGSAVLAQWLVVYDSGPAGPGPEAIESSDAALLVVGT